MRMRTFAIIGLIAIGVGVSLTDAYVTHGRYTSNNMRMRAATVSFPEGNPYRTALSNVVSRFFNNPSDFWFTQTWNDGSIGFDNGQNEVWFSADPKYNPAYTFWWYNIFGDVKEADCVFYNGEAYTTSMTKTDLWTFGGAYRPFETTAAHEYGHASGLSHENDEYNIMGQDWTHIHCNGQTARSYVGEDACDGLVSLYGRYSNGDIQDLSVTLHRYKGKSGEYSTHKMGKMTNSDGVTLSSASFNGQRRYNVSRGQLVNVEFTYENEGETTKTVNIAFYISTNSSISTADRRIATGWVKEARGNVHQVATSLYIPEDLTVGKTYYLGVIIDYDNTVAEVDNANNAAYHIIKVN